MSTDGFPAVELSQEISQSTFVEIISVDETTTRAFRSPFTSVQNAVRQLAYGEGTNVPIPPDPTPPPQVVYTPNHPLRLSAVPIQQPLEEQASFPILSNALFEPEDVELTLTAIADFDFTDTAYPLSNFRSFSTSDGSTSNMWRSITTSGKTISPLPRSAPTDVRTLGFKLAPIGSTTFDVSELSVTSAKLNLMSTISAFTQKLVYQGYVIQWVLGFVNTYDSTPYANMLPIAGGLLDPTQNVSSWSEGSWPTIVNTVNTVGAPDPASYPHLRNVYTLVARANGLTTVTDHVPCPQSNEYDGSIISGAVTARSVTARPTDNAMVLVIKEQKMGGTTFVSPGVTTNQWDMPPEAQIGDLTVTLNTVKTCGTVFTNLVSNSDLSTGTSGWKYSTGTVVESNIPTTAWDSSLHAIVLDSATGPTTIQNADTDIDCADYIGKRLNITFDIMSFTGTSMSLGTPNGTYDSTTTAVQCNIIDTHTDDVVTTKLFYLLDVTYPSKRGVSFVVPPSGQVKVQFVIDVPSHNAGVVKFSNVTCCAPNDNDPAGTERIAYYDRFCEYPGSNQVFAVEDGAGTTTSVIQLGDNIIPIRQNDTVTISFLLKPRELSPNAASNSPPTKYNDAMWPNNLPGRIKITVQSFTKYCTPICIGGSPISSHVFVFDRNPGIKTFSFKCVGDQGFSMTTNCLDQIAATTTTLGELVGGAILNPRLAGYSLPDPGPQYGPESTIISDFTISSTTQTGCTSGVIRDVTCSISWKGIPRKPFNIYNIFARVKMRFPTNPSITVVRHALPGQQTHWGGLGESLWKIADPSTSTYSYRLNNTTYNGITECAPLRDGLKADSFLPEQYYDGPVAKAPTETYCDQVNQGDIVDVSHKTNYIWCVPYLTTGTVDDYFTSEFIIQSTQSLGGGVYAIESVTIFMLSQLVNPEDTSDDSLNNGPYTGTDPATQLQLTLNYTNSLGEAKQFIADFSEAQLFQQTERYPSGTLPWDSVSGIGNGVRAQHARWDAAEFVLDNIAGTGLDQCTPPVIVSYTGSGDLKFNAYTQTTRLIDRKTFNLDGKGKSAPPCTASVLTSVLSSGSSANEIQAVDIPANTTGGTFNLTLTMRGQTNVATCDYNITADNMRTVLASMPLIGSIDNVLVSLIGSTYVITFVGALEATDIPLLIGDGSDLAGAASALITKITTGTANERQTISKLFATTADLVLSYGSQITAPIPYDSTAATVQIALEAVVGSGNVSVDGIAGGPWVVDFIGALVGQSVFLLKSTVVGYTAVRNWSGGTGVNDIQHITVIATGGTMNLVITSQDGSETRTLTGIACNISASQLQSAIAAISFIGAGNVGVTLDATGKIYTIEFKGDLANLPMTLITMSANDLTGGLVTVTELTRGSGASAKQLINVLNATSGFYTLTIPIGNSQYATANIPFDASTGILQNRILNCGAFTNGESVSVITVAGSTTSNRQFIVTFDPKTGVVGQMVPAYSGTLICQNQINIPSSGEAPACYSTITVSPLPGLGNEIQEITLPGSVISGTWTITASINGTSSTTVALAFDALASDVQTALEDLLVIGSGNVTVSKSGDTYTVEFISSLSGIPIQLMTADGSELVTNNAISLTNAGYYVLLDVTDNANTGTDAVLYSNQPTIFVGWNAVAYEINNFYFENECVGLVQFSLNCPYGATVSPVIMTFDFDTTTLPAWGEVRGVVLSQSDWPTDVADARSKTFYSTVVPFVFSDWEGGINGCVDITSIVQDYVNDISWTPGAQILIYFIPDPSGTQFKWDQNLVDGEDTSLGTIISNIGFSNPSINESEPLDATVTITRHAEPVVNQIDHWQFDSTPTYSPGTLLYFKRADKTSPSSTRYSSSFEPKEFSTSGGVPLNTIITNELNNMLGNTIVTVSGDLLDPNVGLTVEYTNQAIVQGFFGESQDGSQQSTYNYPMTLHIWDYNHADLVTSPLPTLTHTQLAAGYNQIQQLTLNRAPTDTTQAFLEITVPTAYGYGETNVTGPHPVTFTAGPFTFSNGVCDQTAYQMAQTISASAFNANLIGYDPIEPHGTDAVSNATFSNSTTPSLLNNAHWSITQPIAFEFKRRNFEFTENALMVVKSSDGASINGVRLYFVELSVGGSEHQYSMTIDDGDSGYYILLMSVGSTIYTTPNIPYNAKATAIRNAIIASGVPTTVYVATQSGSRQRHLSFHVGFGSTNPPVVLTPVYIDTLECIPDTTVITDDADNGPYPYTPDLSPITCQTGHRFQKADPLNDPDPKVVPCCTFETVRVTADVSSRITVQRELVDPAYYHTVRGLAARGRLQISNYTPYIRDFATNTLTQVSYTTPIKSKMSVVFINNSIVNGKDRVSAYLTSSKEILPARNTVLI